MLNSFLLSHAANAADAIRRTNGRNTARAPLSFFCFLCCGYYTLSVRDDSLTVADVMLLTDNMLSKDLLFACRLFLQRRKWHGDDGLISVRFFGRR